jgi:hypothetical protein
MTDLIAKPIVKDQYWVVTDGNKKIGNVVAGQDGYDVELHGNSSHFSTTEDIKKNIQIVFEPSTVSSPTTHPYPEYPTPKKFFNSMIDIKKKLHLFTKTANSKCFHAAGWFLVNHNGTEQVVFCPKYIFIQRYPYSGPFKSKEEVIYR